MAGVGAYADEMKEDLRKGGKQPGSGFGKGVVCVGVGRPETN